MRTLQTHFTAFSFVWFLFLSTDSSAPWGYRDKLYHWSTGEIARPTANLLQSLRTKEASVFNLCCEAWGFKVRLSWLVEVSMLPNGRSLGSILSTLPVQNGKVSQCKSGLTYKGVLPQLSRMKNYRRFPHGISGFGCPELYWHLLAGQLPLQLRSTSYSREIRYHSGSKLFKPRLVCSITRHIAKTAEHAVAKLRCRKPFFCPKLFNTKLCEVGRSWIWLKEWWPSPWRQSVARSAIKTPLTPLTPALPSRHFRSKKLKHFRLPYQHSQPKHSQFGGRPSEISSKRQLWDFHLTDKSSIFRPPGRKGQEDGTILSRWSALFSVKISWRFSAPTIGVKPQWLYSSHWSWATCTQEVNRWDVNTFWRVLPSVAFTTSCTTRFLRQEAGNWRWRCCIKLHLLNPQNVQAQSSAQGSEFRYPPARSLLWPQISKFLHYMKLQHVAPDASTLDHHHLAIPTS